MVLLHEFILTADRVVAFEARYQFESQTATTIPFYKDRLQQLWEDTNAAYHGFLASHMDDADSDEIRAAVAAVEEKHATVFNAYVQFMARMMDQLDRLQGHTAMAAEATKVSENRQPSSPQTAPQPSAGFSSVGNPLFSRNPHDINAFASSTIRHDDDMNNFKVPPCNIKDFDGDHGSWSTFRDLFTAMFIRNSRLSNVERLFHLVHHTKGEAHDIVAKVPLTNAGFTTAWQQLTAAYENKRLLMTEQMTLLHNMPIVTQESETSIKQLQRGINNCLATITNHEISISNWDPFLVFQCCQRLPKQTVELWEQRVCNKKDVIMWSELDTFLTERANTLKSVASTRESSLAMVKPKPPITSNKSHHTQIGNQKKIMGTAKPDNGIYLCRVCNKAKHNIRNCTSFRSLSVQDRWNKVKALNLCFNCLKNDHSASSCPSPYNCSTCHQRHHTILHETKNHAKSNATATSAVQSRNSFHNNVLPSAQALPFQPAAQVINSSTTNAATPPPTSQVPSQYQLFHQQLTDVTTLLPATKCVILGTANLLLKGCFI